MKQKLGKAYKDSIALIREIFDDWLTRGAALICLIIVAVVTFNMNSHIAEEYPFLGTLIFALVPISFIAGGIVFFIAILKFSRQGSGNEAS